MKRKDGFTLVEILVVVGIIAVLMSLMMGGLKAARIKAKKTIARNEVDQIFTAWQSYYADYKRFPDAFANPINPPITDMGADAIRILQGNYAGANWSNKNPRNTPYLDFHAKSTEQAGYKGYEDPWGNVYQVRLDMIPYDGKVTVPEDGEIGFNVAVWSKGPDGLSVTTKNIADDIRSWKDR